MNVEEYIIARVNALLQASDAQIVKRLEGGMSNYTYIVACKGQKYTYRVPGKGGEHFVDRHEELRTIEQVESLGFADTHSYLEVRTGEKLAEYVEGTILTDADIEANIGISKDFNNFELCKAVVTRDMARALMIAEHFARNPKDNPLLLTVMALFGQFKELFVVNYLRWLARHKGRPFPPDTELMRILRKNNTFVIGEIKQNAAGWDNRKVFNILGLLREYDAKSKGLGAGGASDGELLRELLLKIFLL